VTTDYSEVLPVQKLTDGFGKHTEPMLGMRCSRQSQRQKSVLNKLHCRKFHHAFLSIM
jgi:hypothetical protein